MSTTDLNIETIYLKKERQKPTSKVLPKKQPRPTEASQILKRSFKFLEFFGIIIGLDTRYDWKSNIRFFFTIFLTVFIWAQFIYTQLIYVYQHETVKTFEVFAIYGMGVSGILKIACYNKYFKNITALFQSTLNICQQNTGRRGDRLKSRILSNFTFYKFLASLAIIILVLYIYYPVHSFIVNRELVPFVPLKIMFVDQSTSSGYLTASIIMVTMGIYSIFGTEYMGLVFDYLVTNYSCLVDILEVDINELDELWTDTSTSTLARRHSFLRNVCRKYIDMRNYVAEIKNIFDRKLFIFFVFAYLSQILCMYQIRANNWIPGYALAIGFFMEMIVYCAMGTHLILENDRFLYAVTQSKWYTYDLKSQKLMLILMNFAVNSDELWIGPIAPLSVYTATEIVKSIYSYYTVMMEVM